VWCQPWLNLFCREHGVHIPSSGGEHGEVRYKNVYNVKCNKHHLLPKLVNPLSFFKGPLPGDNLLSRSKGCWWTYLNTLTSQLFGDDLSKRTYLSALQGTLNKKSIYDPLLPGAPLLSKVPPYHLSSHLRLWSPVYWWKTLTSPAK